MIRRIATLRRLPFFVRKFVRDAWRRLLYPSELEDVNGPDSIAIGQYALAIFHTWLRTGQR